jgi:hypothetical protein
MDAHPLRTPVRWLIFPLLAGGAGGASGLILDVQYVQAPDVGLTLLFSGLGLCAAGGVSGAHRPWAGVLASTAGGLLIFPLLKGLYYSVGGGFRDVLDVFLELLCSPKGMWLNFLLTGLVASAAWLRLRRGLRWSLLYGVGPVLLFGERLIEGIALDPSREAATVAYYLGQWAALEGALRLSNRPA